MNEVRADASWSESASPERRADVVRIRVGACLVEPEVGRVSGPAGDTSLEPKTMAVLVHLARSPGKVVSADALIEVVWLGRPMGDNPVYRCIAQLRRALGDDPRAPSYIATVPTKGYRLIASVEVLEANRPLPESALDGSPPAVGRPPDAPVLALPRPGRRYGAVAALVALAALAGLALLLWQRMPGGVAGSASAGQSTLAVLPLRTSANDEAGLLLAQSVTDLIRNRLAALKDLTVVATSSTAGLAGSHAGMRSVGAQLHARYLLQGGAERVGARVRVDVQLLDAASGRQLWSSTFDRPLAEVATIRDEIFRHVTDELHIPAGAVVDDVPGNGTISLDAYQLYMRGRQLLARANVAEAGQAVELFRRTTVLDPSFARGYLGLGQALALQARLGNANPPALQAMAESAFDRALQLNPALGEAWIERARLTDDPVKAETLYRKGLALAPNDGSGYVHYAHFLFGTSRMGEAIETIERAIQIDPLTPELYLTQAFFVMVVRSDVAEHDRLVRQALEINPRLTRALYQLAYSRWEFSGEFADGARLIERAIALDPQSMAARMLARDIYLDLGDPVAATAALGVDPPAAASVELAQYEGDNLRAAALLKDTEPGDWPDTGPQAAKAQAIRDAALATGDFRSAIGVLEPIQAIRKSGVPMWYRGFALVYAHTLVLSGDVERGRELAAATLALVDTHGIGRVENWFSRERAAGFAVLGDDDHALEALAHSVKSRQIYRWWYLAGHDPLFQHLRDDPRFQALDRDVLAHRDRQRIVFEQMRREGSGPKQVAADSVASR